MNALSEGQVDLRGTMPPSRFPRRAPWANRGDSDLQGPPKFCKGRQNEGGAFAMSKKWVAAWGGGYPVNPLVHAWDM